MSMNDLFALASEILPGSVERLLSSASSYIPASLDIRTTASFVLIFGVIALGAALLFRLVLGKGADVNQCISGAAGILVIYGITVVVYTFQPWNLNRFLSPLPFAIFSKSQLMIIPFTGTDFNLLCSQILSLVILVFLWNLANLFIPEGEHVLSWYILRLLSIVLSMGLHLAANYLLRTFLPQGFVEYAPSILLVILTSMLLLGIAKVLLGVILTIANPILGGIYTFFFASRIGKQLSKAVLTTMILCVVFYLMEYFGYTVIAISREALLAYLPMLPAFAILWYLIGHEL